MYSHEPSVCLVSVPNLGGETWTTRIGSPSRSWSFASGLKAIGVSSDVWTTSSTAVGAVLVRAVVGGAVADASTTIEKPAVADSPASSVTATVIWIC